MNTKNVQFAVGLLRVQAAHYAELANDYFNRACIAHKSYIYYRDSYEVMKRYKGRHPVILFTIIYIILLIVDTLLSSNLIRPIASEILGSNTPFSFFVASIMYATVILVLTLGASENFYKAAEKNIKLWIELEQLQYPDKPLPIIEDDVRSSVQGSFWKGVAWTIVLFTLTLSLALYRNYIVNDHQLFVFNSPDDWIVLILPSFIATALIYFGQFKSHWQKSFEFTRKMKTTDSKRKSLKAKSYLEGHKAEELNTQAENRNENSRMSQELRICLDRLASRAFTNDDYFDTSTLYELPVVVVRQGIATPNCSVQATTADGKVLYYVTNNEGLAMIQWRSEYGYLQAIRIHNTPVFGDRFEANESITIDLDDLLGNVPLQSTPQLPPVSPNTTSISYSNGSTNLA